MSNSRHGQVPGPTSVLLEPGMWDNLRLSWRLARDARVAPVLKMIVPIAVLLYVLSPIDLIPDFLLGLGQIDDIGVLGMALLLAIRLLPRLAPAEILAEHQSDLGMRPTTFGSGSAPAQERERYVETTYRVHDRPASGESR